MTVQELTRRLTLDELREWMAYDQIEPFGTGRLVLQAAMGMRMQYERSADIDITDLVPFYREPPLQPARVPTPAQQEDMERRMRAFFQRHAGA
jgi:hypothetical protein